MPRIAVILAMLVAARAAGADPQGVQAPACGVAIERAPEGLGESIERRLVALGACGGKLVVWVVRSEDGLYVIAKDELGRVRERVVPDTEVAAALIASWVEIDAATPLTGALALPPPARVAQADDRAAPPAPAAEVRDDDGDGDGDGDAAGDPGDAEPATIGLTAFAGVTLGGMTTAGMVLGHDIGTHDGLSIAVLGLVTRDIASSYYIVHWDDDFFRETGRWSGAAMLEVHRRFGTGRVRFTPGVAFGLGVTKHEILVAPDVPPEDIAMPVMISSTSYGPRLSVSAAFGLHIARSVDLELGAAWMFAAYTSGNTGVEGSDQAVVGALGLRYGR